MGKRPSTVCSNQRPLRLKSIEQLCRRVPKPLHNLTGDEEQEYFVDGLTEELTAELARYQDF